MSKKRVHLICNAHLDPVWQWEWEEGLATTLSTFRTAADLCEEYNEFVFNHNESLLYEWIEEYEPELFERIRKLVKAGRWHIMGGCRVQPDCNMPSGESFVRQALLGKSYFKEKFGVEPSTAINFDPFGHTRGLVQILAKSGYDSYIFCRPGGDDLPLPSEQFVWVGFDGSEILSTRVPGYNSLLGTARRKIEKDMDAAGDKLLIMSLWGVGNHGGGPSRKDLNDLRDLIAERQDFEIVHSTPEAYFADLSKDGLPKREADLNPWAVGCYTSQIRIKQKHRLLENEIYAAEKMSSAAALNGLLEYPKDELKSALHDLTLAEFHDILPGSSCQGPEESSLRLLDHGLEIVSRLKTRAFFALTAGQEKAKENHAPILVYNPHPFKVKAVIDCELQLPDQNWNDDEFTSTPVYQNGKLLPFQNEKESGNVNLDWRKRVVFMAELEPSQMNRFDCKYEILPKRPSVPVKRAGDAMIFETAEYEVAINTKTGLMDRYRVGGVDYIGKNAFEPLVMMDNEDPWGMTVRSFRETAGRFTLMPEKEGTKFSGATSGQIPSVRVIEDGELRVVVEAVFGYGSSAVCLHYILPKTGSEIETLARTYWNEKDRMLKLSIPMPEQGSRYLGQVAYGVQELPTNGDEAVAQKWTAVVMGDKAVTCINDGIYGSDFSDDGLRLTLLRSAAFTGHPIGGRPIVPQDRFRPRIDQGERLFHFWFNGGKTSERMESIDREALAKNEKPFVLQMFPSGIGEKVQPFAVIDGGAVQITAAKLSEDGKDLIVRLFEPTGKSREFTLSLPFCGFEKQISISPFEIKTLRIDVSNRSAVEVDLMEKLERPA